ncbi:MAG: DNA-3-methyladenine glycosylase 2 family protein [Steroidobacteraceae bacterium]
MPDVKPAQARLLKHFDAVDPVIANLARVAGRCTLEESTAGSCFQHLASAIASQQISTLVARKILERLRHAHDGVFPTPTHIHSATTDLLRNVGFSFAKVAALKDLAAKTLDGTVPDDEAAAELGDDELIERLVTVRGIGTWTAQMLLMFRLRRADVLPVDDFGVRKGFQLAYGLRGMPRPKALLAYGERWKPHRSAAAWYLWRAVELKAAGTLPERVGSAPRVAQVKAKARAKRAPRKRAKAQ